MFYDRWYFEEAWGKPTKKARKLVNSGSKLKSCRVYCLATNLFNCQRLSSCSTHKPTSFNKICCRVADPLSKEEASASPRQKSPSEKWWRIRLLCLGVAVVVVHRNSQRDLFVDLPACPWSWLSTGLRSIYTKQECREYHKWAHPANSQDEKKHSVRAAPC